MGMGFIVLNYWLFENMIVMKIKILDLQKNN